MIDDSWKIRGICRYADPELFFPDRSDTATAEEAKSYCYACPVQDECLAAGLKENEAGIWGGTTEEERRQNPRRRTGPGNIIRTRMVTERRQKVRQLVTMGLTSDQISARIGVPTRLVTQDRRAIGMQAPPR